MPLGSPGDCARTMMVTVPANGALLVCPCHGSKFAADGTVMNGSASRTLPGVQVVVAGNDVIVDLSREVPPTARTT